MNKADLRGEKNMEFQRKDAQSQDGTFKCEDPGFTIKQWDESLSQTENLGPEKPWKLQHFLVGLTTFGTFFSAAKTYKQP